MAAISQSSPAPPGAAKAPAAQSEKFDAVAVGTMSFGHFVHDTYPAFLAPLSFEI